MRFDLMVNHFTYELSQCPNEKFVIFEPNFKRNFLHVRDACRAFSFMVGRHDLTGPFNLGLPTANMTKWELAEKVCDVLGLSKNVLSVGAGVDPDRRNYIVSNNKILRTGFEFRHSLEEGIKEVAQLCEFYYEEEIETMRNR
jgi:nucleoside-diphosphate-sugar epimerase